MGKKSIMKVINVEPHGYSFKAIELWNQKGFLYIEKSWEEIDKINEIEADVLIVRLKRKINIEVIKKFKNLKYLVSATTGLDHIDVNYLEECGIKLVSLKGQDEFLKTIPSTAELTWALLMNLIRKVSFANEDVKKGNWQRDQFRGFQLKDKTIGIVGLGRIGSIVAEYAKCFKMNVQYFDPYINDANFIKTDTLEILLKTSDIISFHIHLNENTTNLINTKNIHLLKKNCLLINTSRGKILDEISICEKLKRDEIGGIAVDVLSTELEDISKSYLWKAQQDGYNVIITPHIGGATWDAMWDCEEFIVKTFF